MTKPLAGMYAALMTGLADDGSFCPNRQKALNFHVLGQGLTGLYVGGSSGESGLLGVDELLHQQEIVARDAASTRLIAHVGAPSLRHSVSLAKNAKKLGYHGLSALPPHAYPFTDAEILAYYSELQAATDLPLIVYEVPVRTGRPIALETLTEILSLPHVAGLKFTSTDMFKLSVLRRRCPDATLFFGFDEVYLSGAVLGADGGIGTTYNLLGRLYMALDAAVKAGNLTEAQRLQDISAIFVETLVETGILPGMKAAFRAIGIEVGPTRAPMLMRLDDGEARIADLVSRPEIAEWLVGSPVRESAVG
ncbi:dihydrodipicolinate synthase family protein [Nitratireductor pacificus]|uniref:N-acetylneuraminate lyase n=1 Tax=Nitratireductor pacificus pht-3B TaxID=391937 RepID=K2MIH7_9HYPH|nr:dihydrodipicolinate synthase family protein [Nitratireductor pacificus]EKF20510.1 N-acetylneuraminate lyase [Nitratireductor pacificus pht-3B]